MAKFCSEECDAICDFCKFYKDDDRDIKKNGEFAGEGICEIHDIRVFCHEGYNCDDFECKNVKKNNKNVDKVNNY